MVTASRTNSYGTPRPNAEIYNSLYAAKTRTFGNDFQGKYGGAFLDELKAKYPAIFERVQISNGRKLTTNEKITQWSAKYFNGSNIQGTGARYVLQDNATNQYFNLKAGQTFLPKQMTEITATGFRRVGDIRSNTSQRVATLPRIPSFKSVPTSGITLIRMATWSQVNRSLMVEIFLPRQWSPATSCPSPRQ